MQQARPRERERAASVSVGAAAGRRRGADLALAGLGTLPSRSTSFGGGENSAALMNMQAFTRLQDMLEQSKGPLSTSCFMRCAVFPDRVSKAALPT
jgi:hypothetical protein